MKESDAVKVVTSLENFVGAVVARRLFDDSEDVAALNERRKELVSMLRRQVTTTDEIPELIARLRKS